MEEGPHGKSHKSIRRNIWFYVNGFYVKTKYVNMFMDA